MHLQYSYVQQQYCHDLSPGILFNIRMRINIFITPRFTWNSPRKSQRKKTEIQSVQFRFGSVIFSFPLLCKQSIDCKPVRKMLSGSLSDAEREAFALSCFYTVTTQTLLVILAQHTSK